MSLPSTSTSRPSRRSTSWMAGSKPGHSSRFPTRQAARSGTFTSVLPDINVSGANRPTLTLIPADNGDAVQKFLTPISAETLHFLVETSWPVATVLRLWVEGLNGVPNAASASGPQRDQVSDFERFRRVAELMQLVRNLRLGDVRAEERPVEVSGPLPPSAVTAAATVEAAKNGLEYRPRGDGTTWAIVRKERRLVLEVNAAAVDHPILEELTALLNLQPDRLRYEVIVDPGVIPDPLESPSPPSDEVRVSLRSSCQVYFYLANGVEVPDEHLAAGLVRLPAGPDGRPFDGRAITDGLFTVHSCRGHKPPPTAFVAIKYRDYWYYIDDRDQTSKATFTLMLALSRLDFGRQPPGARSSRCRSAVDPRSKVGNQGPCCLQGPGESLGSSPGFAVTPLPSVLTRACPDAGEGLASVGPVGRGADGCKTAPAWGPVGRSL